MSAAWGRAARWVSLTKQAVQTISRFAFQGNSALLGRDLDGPVKFRFGFVAPTDSRSSEQLATQAVELGAVKPLPGCLDQGNCFFNRLHCLRGLLGLDARIG